jgi:hypothetical protein
MIRELAEVIRDFAAGEERTNRPEDRVLVQKYVAALGPILAAAVAGKPVQEELADFDRLLGQSWLVDIEPFQAPLAKWESFRRGSEVAATPNEAVAAHLSTMVDFVAQAAAIPAEVREQAYSYDSFGSWSVVLRCKGRVLQVRWDGKERTLGVERAGSRKPPFDWEPVATWAMEASAPLHPEVFEAIERSAG